LLLIDVDIDVDVDFTAFSCYLYIIFCLCANGKKMVNFAGSSPTIQKPRMFNVSFLFATLEIATRARKISEDWKRTNKVREGGDVNFIPIKKENKKSCGSILWGFQLLLMRQW
jgi:hypothetical protein